MMHNVKPKVKTIVKETNVKTYCLKLNRSVGVFVLGEEITTHLSLPHEYYHCTDDGSEMTNYDFYFFPESGMDVYVTYETFAKKRNPDTYYDETYCGYSDFLNYSYERMIKIAANL